MIIFFKRREWVVEETFTTLKQIPVFSYSKRHAHSSERVDITIFKMYIYKLFILKSFPKCGTLPVYCDLDGLALRDLEIRKEHYTSFNHNIPPPSLSFNTKCFR